MYTLPAQKKHFPMEHAKKQKAATDELVSKNQEVKEIREEN